MGILILALAGVVAADNEGNMLANSDFNQGRPGEENFGWKIERDESGNNTCTVVEGQRPGARAVRIYNDERGSSGISQQVAVRPWRWYVAEVWVNTDGMYALGWGLGISLGGGQEMSGWRYNYDAYHRPKSGWRTIRVYTHSADSEQLEFWMGGSGWSGELLLGQPLVRECSLVEAVGYYPRTVARHPVLYGPAVDGEKGHYGYGFQLGNVCRVASNFPNSFYVKGRMDAKAPEGRVSLVLPPGVRFRKLQHGGTVPGVSELPDGSQHLELPPGSRKMVVDADLEAGERATGYIYYEWKGGYQLPSPVVFEGVELPDVKAPERAVTALDVYGETHRLWENDKAGLGSQEAMVRDLKRLGFNRLELWGGDVRPYARMGIEGASSFGGSFAVDAEKYPESRATLLDGKSSPGLAGEEGPPPHRKMGRRDALMCPSYRGAGFEKNPWLERVRATAAISSCLTLDDEFYLMSSHSNAICFDDRCMKRWKEWVGEHEPGLPDVDPKQFAGRPHNYPEHYRAWLRFRCDLVAEQFAILRQVFHEAVEKSGVKTTPQPMLGAFLADAPLVGLHSNESLNQSLDYLANMVYADGDGVRREVAELAPRSGGKLLVTLAPGYQMSPPGDARSQVLEAVMGGSKGFIAWNYDIGMTTGHLVDMAEAIKMFAPVEDIILDGAIQDGYGCDRDSVNLLARKVGAESALLVSDYSARPGETRVTVPGRGRLEVIDLFTGEVVARLDTGRRAFDARLGRNFQARLYHLRPAGDS